MVPSLGMITSMGAVQELQKTQMLLMQEGRTAEAQEVTMALRAIQSGDTGQADAQLYAEAVRMFGRKGFVELVTVMGDYVMVGMVLTAIDQHLPPNRPALLPPR